jgi:hypothetical protein
MQRARYYGVLIIVYEITWYHIAQHRNLGTSVKIKYPLAKGNLCHLFRMVYTCSWWFFAINIPRSRIHSSLFLRLPETDLVPSFALVCLHSPLHSTLPHIWCPTALHTDSGVITGALQLNEHIYNISVLPISQISSSCYSSPCLDSFSIYLLPQFN